MAPGQAVTAAASPTPATAPAATKPSPSAAAAEKDAAETYYDDVESDGFYSTVWGGEDIHVGLYDADGLERQSVAEKSELSVQHLDRLLAEYCGGASLAGTHGIDFGAGYGGGARYLASRHQCRVTCLNLAPRQNRRNEELTQRAGLQHRVDVVYGSFEEVPARDGAYDWIWSQDSILHAPDKPKVFREAERVLKPGGVMVISDPMKRDGVDKCEIPAILERICLPDMGSVGLYRQMAADVGLDTLYVEQRPEMLVRHYGKVRQVLGDEWARGTLNGVVSEAFVTRMRRGLQCWVDEGNAGKLDWAVMVFRKPGGGGGNSTR